MATGKSAIRYVACSLLLAGGVAVAGGCGEAAKVADEPPVGGNASVAEILQATAQLEAQRTELGQRADALEKQGAELRAEADELQRQADNLHFRADQLEVQATELRALIAEQERASNAIMQSATALRAMVNNELPEEAPALPAPATSRRTEVLFYIAIFIVLLLLLLRVRRKRQEREEEERLQAIRRQQEAYSAVPPTTETATVGAETPDSPGQTGSDEKTE